MRISLQRRVRQGAIYHNIEQSQTEDLSCQTKEFCRSGG